jgi:hypothetical protein
MKISNIFSVVLMCGFFFTKPVLATTADPRVEALMDSEDASPGLKEHFMQALAAFGVVRDAENVIVKKGYPSIIYFVKQKKILLGLNEAMLSEANQGLVTFEFYKIATRIKHDCREAIVKSLSPNVVVLAQKLCLLRDTLSALGCLLSKGEGEVVLSCLGAFMEAIKQNSPVEILAGQEAPTAEAFYRYADALNDRYGEDGFDSRSLVEMYMNEILSGKKNFKCLLVFPQSGHTIKYAYVQEGQTPDQALTCCGLVPDVGDRLVDCSQDAQPFEGGLSAQDVILVMQLIFGQ